MAAIAPNFNFAGRCEEAMELYQRALGAQVGCLIRYEDANPADWEEEGCQARKNKVYHGELFVGGQKMMMCDNMDAPPAPGTALSLMVTFDTKEEVVRAYDVLREGGQIIYGMQSTTYSSAMAAVVDKFGFRWGMMTGRAEG